MKKIKLIALVMIIFLIGTTNVFALNVKQESLTVDSKSSTITVVDDGIGNLEVTPTLQINEVGDYITYKLVLKNTDGKKYKIESITDDNSNKCISLDYSYSKNLDSKNKNILMTFKYTKKANREDLELKNIKVTIKLIDEDDNTQDITVNGTPKTGVDSYVYIWGAITIIAAITLVVTRKLKNKLNSKKLLGLLILLTLIPTVVFAAARQTVLVNFITENITINLKHTVKFDSDGGSKVDNQIVKDGEKISKPEDPEKEGYNFIKWVDESGNEYDFETPVTEDLTLKAEWKIKEYNVTFDTDGGSNIESQTVEHGKKVAKPIDPEKEKFEFVKWIDEDGNEYDFSTPVTSDITLKAEYIELFTVTFDTDGGSGIESQTIKDGSKVTKPEAPTKKGYEFVKWTLNGNEYDFNSSVTSDISLKATWKTTEYTITYSLDGGTVSTSNPEVYTIETNDITLVNPSKTGYTFTGWTGSNGDEPQTSVTIEKGSTGNKTYTANYTINEYTVTYDSDGGSSVASETKKYQEKFTKPSDPTKTGYEFVKWTLNGNEYDFSTPVTSDITLKAVWEAKEYRITYELDGGTISGTNPTTYTIETDTFTLINPTKEGHQFKGWVKDDGDEPQLVMKVEKGSHGNISFEAIFNEIHTVTFDTDGGTSIPPVEVEHGEKISKPADPTKAGYNFVKWLDHHGNENDFDAPILHNTTITAVWEAKEYSIDYNLDGGTTSTANPETYTIETNDITLKNPTKEGYTFTGWTGSNGDEPQTEVTIQKGSTGNKAYTANYTINEYTITYNSDGGSSVASETKKYQEKFTKPANPTKEHYNFVKWVDEDNNEYDFNTEVTKDITLKAIWEKKEYTVTYDSDGGTSVASETKKYQEKFTKPADPTKEHYNFVKWIDEDNNEYDFNTEVTKNITLKAIWEKKEYTVTYDSDGGSSVASETKKYQETFTKPADPTKTGYEFVKWTLNGTEYDFSTPATSDITLKAEWIKLHTVTFNSDGGSTISSQTIKDGNTVTKPQDPTKTDYTFKYWMDSNDNEYDFSSPVTSDITLKAKWVGIAKLEDSWASFSSILKTGNPSNTNPYNTKNSNVKSFVRATKEEYDAVKSTLTDEDNKFSTSGSTADAYMWFNSSTGTTYWYSESEKVYVSGSFEKVFSNMPNLTDISGLEDFDVSGVTNMNRLFQNSKGLANLTPLSNWDTSGVTNMAFMFGQSQTASTEGMAITDLTPLENWDVSSVKSMHQMFKNCNKLTSVDPLANWNVSSIQNAPELVVGAQNDNKQFEQMFNWCTELTDAKSLAGWDVSNATVFKNMFNNTTNLLTNDMPIFTVKPGIWDDNGTYTPY